MRTRISFPVLLDLSIYILWCRDSYLTPWALSTAFALYLMFGVLSHIRFFWWCCRLVIYFHLRFDILLAYLSVYGFNSKGNVFNFVDFMSSNISYTIVRIPSFILFYYFSKHKLIFLKDSILKLTPFKSKLRHLGVVSSKSHSHPFWPNKPF